MISLLALKSEVTCRGTENLLIYFENNSWWQTHETMYWMGGCIEGAGGLVPS